MEFPKVRECRLLALSSCFDFALHVASTRLQLFHEVSKIV